MDPDLLTFVGAVAVALISALPGVLALLAQRKKAEADAAASLTMAAAQLIDDLREEVECLRNKIAALEAQNCSQQERLTVLQETLDQAMHRIRELELENTRLRALLGQEQVVE